MELLKQTNKGFTLVELIATVAILAVIVGISGYAISGVIKNSKEENYNLLLDNIKSAVEQYRIECTYVSNDCKSNISLSELVNLGFLSGNSGDSNDKLVNPKNNEDISSCEITYSYFNEELTISPVTTDGACPVEY